MLASRYLNNPHGPPGGRTWLAVLDGFDLAEGLAALAEEIGPRVPAEAEPLAPTVLPALARCALEADGEPEADRGPGAVAVGGW
jgi:hypothetical protein